MKHSNANAPLLTKLLILLLFSVAWPTWAEKIWTNSASGLWSDGLNWSGHTPPDITSFIEITNDNTKTVTIDATTAATSLTVQKLTLSAPPGATNFLLLSSVDTNTPLTFQTGLELMDGAVFRITNSAMLLQLTNDHVNMDGNLTLDSGWIDFGDVTVTARVGRVTSGVLTLNSGTVWVGTMTVGGLTNSTGAVYQNGGTLNVEALLSIGRNLSTTGSFFLSGGLLSVPNDDTRVGDEGIGIMTVTNATATLTNLQVGRDAVGTMTIQSGGMVQVQTDVSMARFAGSTGILAVLGGQLAAPGQKLNVGRGGNAQLNFSAGTIEADTLLVNADTTNSVGGTGSIAMTGGALLLTSNLLVGSAGFSSGQALISGGTVSLTNSSGSGLVNVQNGNLTLNGGSVTIDGLVLTNSSGQLTFSSGILHTKSTTVANGTAFVLGDGISSATFYLDGGTHSFANGLVISSNATLAGCGTIIGNIINQGTIATNCGGTVSPPGILQQPQSQTVVEGTTVTFTVSASGTQPLSYQWKLNGNVIAGATDSSYTRSGVQPGDAGSYMVVITNAAGLMNSLPATLTVLIPPAITTQPQSQTVVQGSNVTFSVVATGTAALGYQWELAGTNIASATGSAYTITNVQPLSGGTYVVVITNVAGAITSTPALLTVLLPPTITTPPQGQTVSVGGTANFSVVAAGTAPLAYQWRLQGTNLPGATTSSYTKANVQLTDAGNYTVVVTNQVGSTISPPAALQVISGGLTITFANRTGSTNTIATPSVTGLTYTLQYKNSLSDTNWTDILPSTSGTGNSLLLIDATATGTTRFYRVHAQ